jgi:hypothetical protein
MAPPEPPQNPELPPLPRSGRRYEPATRIHTKTTRISPSKRHRQSTIREKTTRPSAPALRIKAPPLKPSGAFIFAGPNPLYTRHIIEDPAQFYIIEIRCTQPGCSHKKTIKRNIASTGNYTGHYRQYYTDIPTSAKASA